MSGEQHVKPRRQRNFRTKPVEEELSAAPQQEQAEGVQQAGGQQHADEVEREKLEQMRLLHKLRKRQGGTSTYVLAQAQTDNLGIEEPTETVEEEDTQLMGGFSKATVINKSDEDPNMAKFIEAELAKRLGKRVGSDEHEDPETKRKRIEAELYKIPEEFKSNLVGDTVIPGMNTIITEVPVSLSARLRNIEEVENMKKSLLGGGNDGQAKKAGDALPRNQFVMSFGKQSQKQLTLEDREEQQKRMKYISEKRPAVPVHRK